MKRLSIFCVLFVLLLTGCAGKEPNEIAYVVAVGIDRGENGKYNITIQYANTTKISGGGGEDGGGNSEESGVENLSVEAGDIYEAVGIADQIESKTFSLSHTKLIVFSREAAENGILELHGLFMGNDDLRPDVYLAVAEAGAGEYLENINPATEINPAKYFRLIFDRSKLAGLPDGTLNNFYCGVKTGDYDLILPVARAVKEDKIGSAVFRGDKMVGELGAFETELFKLLDRDFASGYLTLHDNKYFTEPVTVKTVQKKIPKYDIDPENKTLTVTITLESDIYSASPEYKLESDMENFRKKCEEYLSGECETLMEKMLREYKSDIFRLNEQSKHKFLTYGKYEEYKNSIDYSDFDVEVKVNFEIRRDSLWKS